MRYALLTSLALFSACGGPVTPPASTDGTLSGDLQFLREEEKLARDVYLTLYERWTLRPHQNIASSEQTHTDRVKGLLQEFSLTDPVTNDGVGVFVNQQLASLYADLVSTGLASEVKSLEVGATIEDLDLRDLAVMLERHDEPSVRAALSSLACGSRNHLRSFTSQLAQRGATYTPQYISQVEFDGIVGSSSERCGEQ